MRMRIASFVRRGLALDTSNGIVRQHVGNVQYIRPLGCNQCRTIPFHTAVKWFLPLHITQPGGQHPIHERWLRAVQKSRASGTAAAAVTDVKVIPERPVIYSGPLCGSLRKVKVFSLISCCLAAIAGPTFVFLTTPHLSVILKSGIAAGFMIYSAATTAALHWVLGPHIHKMTWIPGSKEIEVETLTWMATYVKQTISVEDIRPPRTKRPLVTFAVKDQFFFVDPRRITNKDLLHMVTFH